MLDGCVDDRNSKRDGVVRRFDPEPVVANRLVVRAARDEHDVMPMLREPPADHAANRAGTEDYKPHRGSTLSRTDDAEPHVSS